MNTVRNSKLGITLLATAVLLSVTLIYCYWHSMQDRAAQLPPASLSGAHVSTANPAAQATRSGGIAGANTRPIDAALHDLAAAHTPDASRAILAKLRAYLLSLPKAQASQLIRDFLDGQRDISTQLEFTLGKSGMLTGAPTIRLFLLDLLGQIDPQAANQVALQILSSPGSPDEWAVCLRNYAQTASSAEARTLLQAKFQEMLSNNAWRDRPSVGYLEAFDTVVYTHDTALTPALSALLADQANRAVAHAAYLALDRMVISDPAAVLTQMEAQPQMMQDHQQTRADYFARADVGDPQQKAVLESYLLDPDRTQQELNTFAAIYPNENYMISNNLLTPTATPTYSEITARDRNALNTVTAWLTDPRFQNVQPQLQTMLNRLQTLLREASTGP